MLKFAAAFLLASTVGALAQTTAQPSISLVPLWEATVPYIAAALGTALVGIVGWAAQRFSKLTGVNIDALHREALASAITTGVNYGLAKAGAKIGDIKIPTSQVVADAAGWVFASVPDAVKRLGLTPEAVSKMIEAKIQVADPTAVSVSQAPTVVAVPETVAIK